MYDGASNIVHYSGADPYYTALYFFGVLVGWFILRCINGPNVKNYEYSPKSDAGKC